MSCPYPDGCTNTVTTLPDKIIHHSSNLAFSGSNSGILVSVAVGMLLLGAFFLAVWYVTKDDEDWWKFLS